MTEDDPWEERADASRLEWLSDRLHEQHPAPCELFTTVMGKCTCRQPSLTDFLHARIAEDEAAVWDYAEVDRPRWRAECEAKRRIVGLYEGALLHGSDSAVSWLHAAIEALVQPYADHPDYRAEWRP